MFKKMEIGKHRNCLLRDPNPPSKELKLINLGNRALYCLTITIPNSCEIYCLSKVVVIPKGDRATSHPLVWG